MGRRFLWLQVGWRRAAWGARTRGTGASPMVGGARGLGAGLGGLEAWPYACRGPAFCWGLRFPAPQPGSLTRRERGKQAVFCSAKALRKLLLGRVSLAHFTQRPGGSIVLNGFWNIAEVTMISGTHQTDTEMISRLQIGLPWMALITIRVMQAVEESIEVANQIRAQSGAGKASGEARIVASSWVKYGV